MKKHSFILFALLLISIQSSALKPASAQSILGKSICGYQAWFNCYGDGSPVARWFHWSNGSYQSNNGMPAPGVLKFEAFPSMAEYEVSDIYPTGFDTLGNGQSSVLFSSYKPNVIDKHFEWLQDYDIDGVALQRFISETFDAVFKANRDSVAARVKRSAEKHERIFYIMYDISGLNQTYMDTLKGDWQYVMNDQLHLTESPYYAFQNGKPVVCIWGMGFTDRPGDATKCLEIINWFKAQGCYVIGGVPTNWRTETGDSKSGFLDVYKAFDMLSPWSVGRFSDNTGADNFKTNYLVPDKSFCDANSIAYQPVLFPGFAWSNWNGGAANMISRNKGEFMWRQVYNIQQAGITNCYFAMMDEYDEGTALMKMADSYYDIPSNQYFLTTSADGEYISSDFYLRLSSKAAKVINGTDAISSNVPIPRSIGPVWYRTSFETNYDAMPTWVDAFDPNITNINMRGYNGVTNPECSVVNELAHIGTGALRFALQDNSSTDSKAALQIIDVDIPINEKSVLNYSFYPENDLSRYIAIDLILTDGSRLSETAGLDLSIPKGTISSWSNQSIHIGNWLNGKIIDRIILAYNHADGSGNIRGYIDDLWITEEEIPITETKNVKTTNIHIAPNPATDFLLINSEQCISCIQIYNIEGICIMQVSGKDELSLSINIANLTSGVYVTRVITNKETTNEIIIKR